MKYWKNSKGEFGTMDDDGYDPGSVECTKLEYDVYISSIPKRKRLVDILYEKGVLTKAERDIL